MFLTQARNFIQYEEAFLFGHTGGRTNRFRPGQSLHPSDDAFLREKVQPVVSQYHMTPLEDLFIRFFAFFNIIFITTVIELFQWMGYWNLLSYDIWPYPDLRQRDVVYFCMGLFLIFVSMRYFSLDDSYQQRVEMWEKGFPSNFGFSRKIKSFFRKNLNFLGYLFAWVGAWDFIDSRLLDETAIRDALYVIIPIFVLFVLEQLLSPESLYYVAARLGQRRLSFIPLITAPPSSPSPPPPPSSLAPDPPHRRCCWGIPYCQPGQELYPAQDFFLCRVVQPTVKDYVSPFEDWLITVFNWINNIALDTVVQLFMWVGMWDSFSYYVWPYPNTEIRDLCYTVFGFMVMFLSYSFFDLDKSYYIMEGKWHNGLPGSFGLYRKFKDYLRETLNFLGFLFVWVGAWDFMDTQLWGESILRDCMYVLVPLFISFVFDEMLSVESVYYLVVKFKIKTGKAGGGKA